MVHCFPWKAPRAALLPSALRVAWGMASLDRFSEDSRGETLGELKQNGWLYQQEEGFVGKSKKWDIMGYIYIMGYWLVVWSMNFIFPYWEFHNPNWLSYFSEGLKPPTSYISHIYTNFKRKEVFKTENVCQSKDHVGIHWLLSKISLDMHRAMSKPPRSQAAEVWFSYHGHKLLTRGCWRQVSPRRLGVLSLDSGLPPGCHLPWLDDENKP